MAVFLVIEPRSVFIHIPKTGGASIRRGFFEDKVEGPKQGFIPESWQSLFKFAFVRNPYDRIISAWKMFDGGMEQTVWEHPQDKAGIELNSFLSIVIDESIAFDGRSRETTVEKIRHHTLPQVHPYHCLDRADFVGRFENLASDFDVICQRLGIEATGLPHWNRTKRDVDFMRYFDSGSIKIVNEYFRDDFEQLGYQKVSV